MVTLRSGGQGQTCVPLDDSDHCAGVMVMILIMTITVVMEIVAIMVCLDDGKDAVSGGGGGGLCDDNKNDNISYIRSGVHVLFDVLPS